MKNDQVMCSSCGKPKLQLQSKRSRLLPGMQLLLCGECISNKYEPRFLIILVGRAEGLDAIKDYIDKYRYVGSPITAQELV